MTRHHASLFFPFPTPIASAIARALAPEAASTEVPKTRGEIRATADGVAIELHADDLASLRAAVNSHIRWVDAAEKAARVATQ